MKTYNVETVKKETLSYFNQDELACKVWMDKYALLDSEERFLEKSPDDMHVRLSKEFARIESKYDNPLSYERIYEKFYRFEDTIAQGSPSYGVGNSKPISVANCFVIDLHDSYGSIMAADTGLASIYRRRGGCGVDLSAIRPINMPVNNAAKTTAGIVPFMERFSNTTREVGQQGRRGALMQTISIHHPEVKAFIKAKMDRKKVTGANVSVKITDEFMNAVVNNEKYEQRWPVDSSEPEISQMVSAKEIWNLIIHCAWFRAEPGVLFWDTVLRTGPADIYENHRSVSTNPCSEISLSPYDACRLLVLNTTSFVENKWTEEAYFNFEKFRNSVEETQRLMDDLVDIEIEKIDKILIKIELDPEPDYTKEIEKRLWNKVKEKALAGRRTGLGLTGIGDTLAMCNIQYGSGEGNEFVENIYKNLSLGAYTSSIKMAKERGAFPDFDRELERGHEFIERILSELPEDIVEMYEQYGRRNIALTTTAPCGSISLMAQTTSGIEPAFMLEYIRRRKLPAESEIEPDFVDDSGDKWENNVIRHHKFQEWVDFSGSTSIEESPYMGATANEIDWMSGIQLQANAQKWICHSISKTANLPSEVSEEQVGELYLEAWKSGCKGFTVYRDGCRSGVLIKDDEDTKTEGSEVFEQRSAPSRPEILECDIHHSNIKGEKWTIFVGMMDGKPYEVFGGLANKIELPTNINKGEIIKHPRKTVPSVYDLKIGDLVIQNVIESFDNANYGTHTRLISLALRHGGQVEYVVSQLQKDRDSDMFSFSRVLARVLKKYIKDGTKTTGVKTCAECKSESLVYQDGCVICMNCGYSACN